MVDEGSLPVAMHLNRWSSTPANADRLVNLGKDRSNNSHPGFASVQ